MDKKQYDLVVALFKCSLPPNSADKNFAREMASLAAKQPDYVLSIEQDRRLNQICFKYRKQVPLDGLVEDGVGIGKKSTLHHIGPSLAEHGLLKNEPWVVENCARAEQLFVSNSFLKVEAVIFAAIHKYGLDYIEQAPVLVTALIPTERHRNVKEHWVKNAIEVADAIKETPKLKDLMRRFGLAVQLRVLEPYVLGHAVRNAVRMLSLLPPSTLAQVIPTSDAQLMWMMNVRLVVAALEESAGFVFAEDQLPVVEWAARHGTRGDFTALGISDFISRSAPGRFNPVWGFERVVEETNRWHTELGRMTDAAKFEAEHAGFRYDQEVEYGELPIDEEFCGYQFVAVKSPAALHEEGKEMHHCIFSYVNRLISGKMKVYSVRLEGKRVATIDIARNQFVVLDGPLAHGKHPQYRPEQRWAISQMAGPCNEKVSNTTESCIRKFMAKINGQKEDEPMMMVMGR